MSKRNVETMQQFCDENDIKVTSLKHYRVDKGYQKVLYVSILLPNGEIIERVWNYFKIIQPILLFYQNGLKKAEKYFKKLALL